MKAYNCDPRNLLQYAHPDLKKLALAAAVIAQKGEVRFIVTESERTLAKQKENFAKGATKTMRSRHIPSCNKSQLACAIDVAAFIDSDDDGVMDASELTWAMLMYAKVNGYFMQASKETGIPYEWGGDWKSFKDGPHFQLPWVNYP
jgi:peptidoglycan L-alanyl-D-glutamate endopeptidase CwlK